MNVRSGVVGLGVLVGSFATPAISHHAAAEFDTDTVLRYEGVIKEFVELSAEKGVSDGFGVALNVTGEGPRYTIRTLARSEADYHAQNEKNLQLLGDEGLALRNKAGAMIHRIEFSGSLRRPDLSYQP